MHRSPLQSQPSESDTLLDQAPAARCADGHGTLNGLFFSDDMVDIARAKAVCARCPLQASCLADALAREEPWGVWGGQLLSGGRIIANKRPCGRPPKQPRVEVLIDELGQVTVSTADVDRPRRKPEPTRRRREGSVASAG